MSGVLWDIILHVIAYLKLRCRFANLMINAAIPRTTQDANHLISCLQNRMVSCNGFSVGSSRQQQMLKLSCLSSLVSRHYLASPTPATSFRRLVSSRVHVSTLPAPHHNWSQPSEAILTISSHPSSFELTIVWQPRIFGPLCGDWTMYLVCIIMTASYTLTLWTLSSRLILPVLKPQKSIFTLKTKHKIVPRIYLHPEYFNFAPWSWQWYWKAWIVLNEMSSCSI